MELAGNIATESTYNTAGVSGLTIYGNDFCVSSGGSTLASTQFHGVVCCSLTNGAETFTVGGNFAGTAKAGRPLGSSAENVAASSASLFNPATRVHDHDRPRLEMLIKYISRPPVAMKRLSKAPGGLLQYKLKTPFRNGKTYVLLSPEELMEKLTAIILKRRL
jgi:hypothetical protein